MRITSLLVVAVVFCPMQVVKAQNTGAPVTLEPPAIFTQSPSPYYVDSKSAASPQLYATPPTTAYPSATGSVVQYPGYTVYRPVVPVMSIPRAYYFGRGILGQPKLYVPGQPIRNALRYLTL